MRFIDDLVVAYFLGHPVHKLSYSRLHDSDRDIALNLKYL